MNVKKRELASSEPMTRIKNAGSTRGGANQAKAIKNATGPKPKAMAYAVPKNSITCVS